MLLRWVVGCFWLACPWLRWLIVWREQVNGKKSDFWCFARLSYTTSYICIMFFLHSLFMAKIIIIIITINLINIEILTSNSTQNKLHGWRIFVTLFGTICTQEQNHHQQHQQLQQISSYLNRTYLRIPNTILMLSRFFNASLSTCTHNYLYCTISKHSTVSVRIAFIIIAAFTYHIGTQSGSLFFCRISMYVPVFRLMKLFLIFSSYTVYYTYAHAHSHPKFSNSYPYYLFIYYIENKFDSQINFIYTFIETMNKFGDKCKAMSATKIVDRKNELKKEARNRNWIALDVFVCVPFHVGNKMICWHIVENCYECGAGIKMKELVWFAIILSVFGNDANTTHSSLICRGWFFFIVAVAVVDTGKCSYCTIIIYMPNDTK